MKFFKEIKRAYNLGKEHSMIADTLFWFPSCKDGGIYADKNGELENRREVILYERNSMNWLEKIAFDFGTEVCWEVPLQKPLV